MLLKVLTSFPVRGCVCNICVWTCPCACMWVDMCGDICVWTHMYACVSGHMCVDTCAYIVSGRVYVWVEMCVHVCMHCEWTCVCICMCEWTCVCICMCEWTCVWTRVHVRVDIVCVCGATCVHVYRNLNGSNLLSQSCSVVLTVGPCLL